MEDTPISPEDAAELAAFERIFAEFDEEKRLRKATRSTVANIVSVSQTEAEEAWPGERGLFVIPPDVQGLIRESDADPSLIVPVCSALRRVQQEQFPFHPDLSDPNALRRYINYLMHHDVRVAIGEMFHKANEVYQASLRNDVPANLRGHQRNVMERVYDLVRLFHEMCRGHGKTAGRARLMTLLRYMHEEHYHQGTQAVRELCSTEDRLYELDGQQVSWTLQLEPGDLAIDLGCGPATEALDILEQRAGKGNVRGIDVNPLAAMKDLRKRVGVIDIYQPKIRTSERVEGQRLSFENYNGRAGLVLGSLVFDRIASHVLFLQNCAALVRPGGTLCLALYLPVEIQDNEPGLDYPIQYTVETLTNGERWDVDFELIETTLHSYGFQKVMLKKLPIDDPVSEIHYDNHYLIVAIKEEARQPVTPSAGAPEGMTGVSS